MSSLISRYRSRLARLAPRRRFRTDEDGATAVEFAIVAMPFFALLLAVMETALIFFAGQVLETATADAARLVRTGQVQEGGIGEAQFKDELCGRVFGLLDCTNKVVIDVRTYEDFDAVALNKPVDGAGNFSGTFIYQPGVGGDIVTVRAFYQWPTIIPNMGLDMADLANGSKLLAAAVVFRNEPF